MATHRLLSSFIMIVAASSVYMQTFEYSRGWTNGKRSDGAKVESKMATHRLLSSFIIIVVASSVYTQTFQYSRGWTNGKRSDGAKVGAKLENVLERAVDNPCQFAKLKYILEGKPITEKIFMPCDYGGDEESTMDAHPKRPPYGKQRGAQEPIFDNFL